MNNNAENGDVGGDTLSQNNQDTDGYTGGDDGRQDSEQSSSDSQSSMPSSWPSNSDDTTTTSDECRDHEVQNAEERKPSASHHSVNKSFSTQLMNMLISETKAGSDAVQWLSDGSGFVIKKQNELERQILPRYFDGPCIFQSFTRRLYRQDTFLLALFVSSDALIYYFA